jgi:YVTN family beta-propeller protein
VHGVLAVPELGHVYATATGDNEVAVIDAASLAVVARVPVGRFPDGLACAPATHKLYVSDKKERRSASWTRAPTAASLR